jgi:hypothetical protein
VIFYVGILASIPTKKKFLADYWGYSPQKIPLQLSWGFSQSQGCGQGFVRNRSSFEVVTDHG